MRIAVAGMMLAGMVSIAVAQETNVTVTEAGAPVFTITAPVAGTKFLPTPEKTTLVTTNMFLYIWSVPKATTIAEALPRVNDVIKGEVLEFKIAKTNTITVADAPALHLMGSGKEADDGDPGTDDVVVFTVGKRAFIACVHGENNDASRERQPMLDALKTVKKAP